MKLCITVFSCNQAALKHFFPSVRPSVCTSVRLSHLFDNVPVIILKFSGVITIDRRDIHAKGKGQRSRSQRSRPNLAIPGLWLQFEFTYGDEMMHKAWCYLGEVTYCFSRSSVKFQGHTATKIIDFDPNWAFADCNSSLNSVMAIKWCTKLGPT